MPDLPTPATIAGWALVGGRQQLDVPAVLDRHGAIYRWPLGPEDPAELLAPGQPCFAYVTDRSRTVGLWAVGSVVAEVLELAPGTPLLPGEAALVPTPDPTAARRWAEVEMLGLDKPVPAATLAGHRDLAGSALLAPDLEPRLLPLGRAEVRAIESLDLWLREPEPEARQRLDAMLAEEDDLLG